MEKTLLKQIADHIHKKSPTTPLSHIHLAIYICVSEFLCFNRVKISLNNHTKIFPNLYGLTFMRSGAGKDRVIKDIKKIFPFFINGRDKFISKIYEKKLKKLYNEAEEKGLKGSPKEKYIKENLPYYITTETSRLTIEGISQMRETLQDEKIGHVHFQHSEFAGFIKTSQNFGETLSFLTEIYDGDNSAKLIKGNKHCKAVSQVPQTMFGLSSPDGLIADDRATKDFLSFLDSGLARRMFLCYPNDKDFGSPIDHSENWEEFDEEIYEEMKKLQEIILEKEKYFYTYDSINGLKDIVIHLSDDAKKSFKKYEFTCQVEGEKEKNRFSSEISSRPMKMIRLAGVLSFLFSDNKIIDNEIIDLAIKITEGYGVQYKSFYGVMGDTLLEKLYNYIKNRNGVTRTMCIRNVVTDKRRDDKKFLDSLFLSLNEKCIENEEVLLEDKRKGGSIYSIEKHDWSKFLKIDNTPHPTSEQIMELANNILKQ